MPGCFISNSTWQYLIYGKASTKILLKLEIRWFFRKYEIFDNSSNHEDFYHRCLKEGLEPKLLPLFQVNKDMQMLHKGQLLGLEIRLFFRKYRVFDNSSNHENFYRRCLKEGLEPKLLSLFQANKDMQMLHKG